MTFPSASRFGNTPPRVPAPGVSTPIPGTAAIASIFLRPSGLSMITMIINSPFGLSGHTSAFSLYSFSLKPQAAGASPTASGRVPPLDLKRMAEMTCFTSSGVVTSTITMPITPVLSCLVIRSAARAGLGATSGVFTNSGCPRLAFVAGSCVAIAFANSANGG